MEYPALLSELCPLSRSINFAKTNILPYPNFYLKNKNDDASKNPEVYNCTHRDILQASSHAPQNGIMLTCSTGICPVVYQNVRDAMPLLLDGNRNRILSTFCDLLINDNSSKKDRQIIVLGNSMTFGIDVGRAGCCSSQYCSTCVAGVACPPSNNLFSQRRGVGQDGYFAWPAYFYRWFRDRFPNQDTKFVDRSVPGYTSYVTFLRLDDLIKDTVISKDDIILLDFSNTDKAKGDYERGEAFYNLPGLEKLIRQLIHISRGGKPNIVITDYWPDSILNETHISSAYKQIARHYELEFWSFADMASSEYAIQNQSNFLWALKSGGVRNPILSPDFNHPPWHCHMFVADLYASCLLARLAECSQNKNSMRTIRSAANLPNPIFDIESLLQCDKRVVFVDVVPLEPNRVGSVQMKGGWIEHAEIHGGSRPGFIVSASAANAHGGYGNAKPQPNDVSLSFNSDRFVNVARNARYLLKILYLKTYLNAGRFTISLCGKSISSDPKLVEVDTLYEDQNTRVSLPTFHLVPLSGEAINSMCSGVPHDMQALQINWKKSADRLEARKDEKVKLMYIHFCKAA